MTVLPPGGSPGRRSCRRGAAAPKVWKDGTYTGWGFSPHGNIEATVTIEGGRIASAVISQCRTRYSCAVIDTLPPEVAQRQSPDVDYVSGATQSADAFYEAVVAALDKAKAVNVAGLAPRSRWARWSRSRCRAAEMRQGGARSRVPMVGASGEPRGRRPDPTAGCSGTKPGACPMWRRIRRFFRTPKGLVTIVLAILILTAAPGQSGRPVAGSGVRSDSRGPG